ncbi:hypothetical protein I118_2009 [Bifidobacterium longum D2957]|nr:hypothetical protein I118_2009 [Bifidobacterium longum D2957]
MRSKHFISHTGNHTVAAVRPLRPRVLDRSATPVYGWKCSGS